MSAEVKEQEQKKDQATPQDTPHYETEGLSNLAYEFDQKVSQLDQEDSSKEETKQDEKPEQKKYMQTKDNKTDTEEDNNEDVDNEDTNDDVQEKEEEGKGEEEEKAPTFSDEVVERASEYGLNPSDFKDQATLEKVLTRLDIAQGKKAQDKPQEKTEQTEDSSTKEDDSEEDFFNFELNLDPEEHDPEVIETLDGLVKSIKDQFSEKFKKIQEQIGDTKTVVDDVRREKQTKMWDNIFDSLEGEGFDEAFGSGGIESLEEGSEAITNRNELVKEVSQYMSFLESKGETKPLKDVAKMIAATKFTPKVKETKKNNMTSISKPTKRSTKQPTEKDALEDLAKEFDRKAGVV